LSDLLRSAIIHMRSWVYSSHKYRWNSAPKKYDLRIVRVDSADGEIAKLVTLVGTQGPPLSSLAHDVRDFACLPAHDDC
jgi:hypothetical protein